MCVYNTRQSKLQSFKCPSLEILSLDRASSFMHAWYLASREIMIWAIGSSHFLFCNIRIYFDAKFKDKRGFGPLNVVMF